MRVKTDVAASLWYKCGTWVLTEYVDGEGGNQIVHKKRAWFLKALHFFDSWFETQNFVKLTWEMFLFSTT